MARASITVVLLIVLAIVASLMGAGGRRQAATDAAGANEPAPASTPGFVPRPFVPRPGSRDQFIPAGKTAEQATQAKVSLIKFGWRKGGFDTVMIASFTIDNANDVAIKDILVTCELTAHSGTAVGVTAATIYERIPAHARKTIREVNMGSGVSIAFSQAATASCKLASFEAG
jgi:hypothetical protein